MLCYVVPGRHSADSVASDTACRHYLLANTSTSCTPLHSWFIDQIGRYVQASEFMHDEEGTQELCRQAASWLFGAPGSLMPSPELASDQACSEGFEALSEDDTQVRYSSACSQLQYHTLPVL